MRTYQAEKAINELFRGHIVNFSSKSGMKYFTISIGESKQENIDNYLDKVWEIFEDKIAQKSLRKNKSGFGSWEEYWTAWPTKPGFKASVSVSFKENCVISIHIGEEKDVLALKH